MIRQYPKSDREKLEGLKKHFIRKNNDVYAELEPFLLFTNDGEDKYYGWTKQVTEYTAQQYRIRTCDMLIFTAHNTIIFFELDGGIHDIKTEKTAQRNRRYELNNIPYIVINESELKEKLGIPQSRNLTQEQINAEFDERLAKL
jgi:hypothetical protein